MSLIEYIVLFVLFFYIAFPLIVIVVNLQRKHYKENLDAWFISMPGFISFCIPERTIELKELVGKKLRNIEINSSTDIFHQEILIGKNLLLCGEYRNWKLLQGNNGHWILYKPQERFRRFSLESFYRISSGGKCLCNNTN